MLTIGVCGAARVVQVGEAVGEARPAMQQRRGRLAGHARVAVGGAGHHALEQSEHAAHARARGRVRRRSASPTCRGCRSRYRRRCSAGCGRGFRRRSWAGPFGMADSGRNLREAASVGNRSGAAGELDGRDAPGGRTGAGCIGTLDLDGARREGELERRGSFIEVHDLQKDRLSLAQLGAVVGDLRDGTSPGCPDCSREKLLKRTWQVLSSASG